VTNRDGGIKWPVGGVSSKNRVQGTEENMAIDKNMQILVVDDYNTMLRILKNLPKQLGFHNVDQAMDGNEALQKLKASAFDFIISDWNMEPMTGIELLREVRGNEKLKHIPFIMITAESKTENVIAAQQAGVSNYIVKPFNAETLKGKMASVLGAF
jgi:two-component system chemotaxis response regulator CheY